VERATGPWSPWLLHRDGTPIKSLYGAWRTACKEDASSPGMPMHDLRLTVVQNLERAGASRLVALR
jgi:hypothetical protein